MTNEQFEPFYDVNLTYDDNYRRGPFGQFAQALAGEASALKGEAAASNSGTMDSAATSESASATDETAATHATPTEPATVLGFPVNLPFGIPAGPLLNSRFTTAAFRMGFDLAVYKTVR